MTEWIRKKPSGIGFEIMSLDGEWVDIDTPEAVRDLLYRVGIETPTDELVLAIRYDHRDGKILLTSADFTHYVTAYGTERQRWSPKSPLTNGLEKAAQELRALREAITGAGFDPDVKERPCPECGADLAIGMGHLQECPLI